MGSTGFLLTSFEIVYYPKIVYYLKVARSLNMAKWEMLIFVKDV